jgi:hypothetical protein
MSAYYQLWTHDERDNNYVTMQENLYGAPSVFQSYIPYFCRACRRVNQKAVFQAKEGFEAGPQIRVKTGREFAHSGEGFLLIKTRVLRLLKRFRVAGFAARSIPRQTGTCCGSHPPRELSTSNRRTTFPPARNAAIGPTMAWLKP